ncbi:MAG: DUF192 domain-containing protein [Rhodothermia bacterium]|nr:MAG: DUF192 domain-containing protein [Rhodothermia bacterium]
MPFSNATASSRLGSLTGLVFLIGIGLGGLGCEGDSSSRVIRTDIEFRPDGLLDFVDDSGEIVTRIVIEIAESDSAQARGLMDRRSIPARGGMLFLYQEPGDRRFWMRSTPLPLDIIFVRADSSIANIVKRTTPYSDQEILSVGPAQFVVEVRGGFTDQFSIQDSLRIKWERTE